MKVEGFIWLEQYVDKLEIKHGVTPAEVSIITTLLRKHCCPNS